VQIYSVGGAVRDELLGLPVKDRDYVVVGATAEEMVSLGFKPVGKDFPVFLHPRTQEEYALARTERKTAPGYKGFVIHADVGVTLEEDLLRRDLTMNAIARAEDGSYIDPFGGRNDIRAHVFRHVSDAFSEDPVRILRVARFAARFTAFNVAPTTLLLMQKMVEDGEVDALVPERVWQEVSRGLTEQQPARMFDVLAQCHALSHIIPEVAAVWTTNKTDHLPSTLNQLPVDWSLQRRFAALALLCTNDGDVATRIGIAEQLSERLKVPRECRDLAVMAVRERDVVSVATSLNAEELVNVLMRCDGLRKPQRFEDMLVLLVQVYQITNADMDGQAHVLRQALRVLMGVDAGAIALTCKDQPQTIPDAVHAARVNAMATFVRKTHG
jgi:tRNA nucleotidyltransferase (CCA-adding enzyme)